MTGAGPVIDMATEKDVEKKMTVRAIDGDKPSELYVHYERWEESTSSAGGPPRSKGQSLAGKTYVVGAVADSKNPSVRDPDGAEVPSNEADEVAGSMRSDFRADPFATALAGRTFRIGEDLPAVAEALSRHFADSMDETVQVENARVVLRRLEGDEAIFDLSMRMKFAQKMAPMWMDLTGEAHIATKTTRTTHVELRGPITLDIAGMKGGGTLEVVSTQR